MNKKGRPKGALNRRTVTLLEALYANGYDPAINDPVLLLWKMGTDPLLDPALRNKCLSDCAPYLHARRTKSEIDLIASMRDLSDADLQQKAKELYLTIEQKAQAEDATVN